MHGNSKEEGKEEMKLRHALECRKGERIKMERRWKDIKRKGVR